VPFTHPHHRRLPKHARHLASQMLALRAAPQRASVLEAHVRQLDHAVSFHERAGLTGDTDSRALGQRVILGPETRSLLRQLLDSRDMRVQQSLVREIRHQVQRRILAAVARSKAIERARERAARAAAVLRERAARAAAVLRERASQGVARAQERSRRARVTRTRHMTTTRGPQGSGYGTVAPPPPRARRTRKAAPDRASRTRATR
jgi:hypothetical protein